MTVPVRFDRFIFAPAMGVVPARPVELTVPAMAPRSSAASGVQTSATLAVPPGLRLTSAEGLST